MAPTTNVQYTAGVDVVDGSSGDGANDKGTAHNWKRFVTYGPVCALAAAMAATAATAASLLAEAAVSATRITKGTPRAASEAATAAVGTDIVVFR